MDRRRLFWPSGAVTMFVMLMIEALFPGAAIPAIPGAPQRLRLLTGRAACDDDAVAAARALAAGAPAIIWKGLGVIGGATWYGVVSLVSYAWHRSAPTFPLMWRTFHQIHHSPQRGRHVGAACHPSRPWCFRAGDGHDHADLGLDPVAAALTGYIAAFYALPAHERAHAAMARLHHPAAGKRMHSSQRDVHAYNYGELAIGTCLFGPPQPERFAGDVASTSPATGSRHARLADVMSPWPARHAGAEHKPAG